MSVWFLLLAMIVAAARGDSHNRWHRVNAASDGVFTDGPFAHPPGRRNAALWCLEEDVLYLLGGRGLSQRTDDLWRYEEAADRWIWLGDGPHAGSGFTAWTPDSDHLWAFGGRLDDGTALGRIHVYDVKRRRWTTTAPSTRERPTPRYGALSWYSRDTGILWLYGGKNANRTLLRDLWSFDMRTLAWTQVSATPQPGTRDDAAAVTRGAIAYVLGGEGSSLELWRLDMNTMEWTQHAAPPIEGGELQDHAMWMTPEGDKLVVFGGRLVGGDASPNPWEYTIATDTWTKAHSGPTARWGASSCQDPEGYTFIVAGVSSRTKYLNDVWKYGKVYSRASLVLYGDTLQSNTAAVMATLTFVLLAVAVIVRLVYWCNQRRVKEV